MTTVADQIFGDLVAWQDMLNRYHELFLEMEHGSRIGFVSREASGILPGKHREGVQTAKEVSMLAWQQEDSGMAARIERFAGMASTQVDLLLVADEEAVTTMREQMDGDVPSAIKRLIRRGRIMFFCFKNKSQLQDAGYEDFLDSLGLAFLGACR